MKVKSALVIGCAISALSSAAAIAQDQSATPTSTQQETVEEEQEAAAPIPAAMPNYTAPGNNAIVVTARRREELLSETPVSVTALSGDDLSSKSITSLEELTQSTPGLIFGQSGASSNPRVVIRGQSRANLGDAAQPVLTYFNDLPLPYVSQIIPTYDLASVQVLKGP